MRCLASRRETLAFNHTVDARHEHPGHFVIGRKNVDAPVRTRAPGHAVPPEIIEHNEPGPRKHRKHEQVIESHPHGALDRRRRIIKKVESSLSAKPPATQGRSTEESGDRGTADGTEQLTGGWY